MIHVDNILNTVILICKQW